MQRSRSSPRSARAWLAGLILILAAHTTVLALPPSTRKAATPPPPDTTPLGRYVPGDKLRAYVEFAGLDTQGAAWRKTAAYRMLNETALGLMLEDVAAQLAERTLNALPNRKVSGVECVALAEHVLRSGFAIAVIGEAGPAGSEATVLVLRGASRVEIREPFSRLRTSFSGPVGKPKLVSKPGSRTVIHMPGAQAAGSWGWFSEKNDLVIALDHPEALDLVIDVLEAKRHAATDHPIRTELLKAEGGFQPIGLAFLDPAAWPSGSEPKVFGKLGTRGLKRVDSRWGFQGEALLSVTRLHAPTPRQGSLALFDQPTFSKATMPPLPLGAAAFTVLSLDLLKSFGTVLTLAKSLGPEWESSIEAAVDRLRARSRQDLRKNILAHLGPKMVLYNAPGDPASPADRSAEPGSGPIAREVPAPVRNEIGRAPRFTLLTELKDEEAFKKALAEVMIIVNKDMRAWATAVIKERGEASAASKPRRKGVSQTLVPEFIMMPGKTRCYALSVPNEFGRLPAGIRPTIRVGPKHVAFSLSYEAARQALDLKVGALAPPADLATALDPLAASLVALSVNDSRSELPARLASLPAALEESVNAAISGQIPLTDGLRPPGESHTPTDPGMTPGAGRFGSPMAGTTTKDRAGPLKLTVAPERVPVLAELQARLFPSTTTVEVDPKQVAIRRRQAFPDFGLLTDPTAMAVLGPAVRQAWASAVRTVPTPKPTLVPPAAPPQRKAAPRVLKPN